MSSTTSGWEFSTALRIAGTAVLATSWTHGQVEVSPVPHGQSPNPSAFDANKPAQIQSRHGIAAPSAAAPLTFVENRGQWPTPAQFVAQFQGAIVRAEAGGLWFELRGLDPADNRARSAVMHCRFEGSSAVAQVEGVDPRPGTYNFLLGNDPTAWRTGVRGYSSIRYHELWPGVDLILSEKTGALFEYSFVLGPGANPNAIRMQWEGVEEFVATPTGCLRARSGLGVLEQTSPVAWYLDSAEKREFLACEFSSGGKNRHGFALPGRDPSRPVIIDPGIVWSSYLGGSWDDIAFDVDLASDGDAVVVGESWALDFPSTTGVIDVGGDHYGEAFVSRIEADGTTLVFSTFLGGAVFPPGTEDVARCVHLESNGAVTVAGYTTSSDFPVTAGAYDTTYNDPTPLSPGPDAFIARLRSDGTSLLFSTYFGGAGYDYAFSMASGPNGEIAIAGSTTNSAFSLPNLPTTVGAFQSGITESYDLFVSRFSGDGKALLSSTMLGVAGNEQCGELAVEPSGTILICGATYSASFPSTSGAFDPTFNAPTATPNAFVSRLSADATQLPASTFIGGGIASASFATALDLLPTGDIVVTGLASGPEFPTTPGAFDAMVGPPDVSDAFISILSADLGQLRRSTLLGGEYEDTPEAVVAEWNGSITIAGWSYDAGFPTTPGAFGQSSLVGDRQGFVTRLRPDLGALLYSSYVASSGSIVFLYGLALDSELRATVVGVSTGPGYPTTPGALDTTYGGSNPQSWGDGVVTRIDLLPTGAARFGASTPACLGPIQMGALGAVSAGNANFSLYCTGAPQLSAGILALALGQSPVALPILGVSVFLDPGQLLPLAFSNSDATGFSARALPIPATAAGITGHAQWIWINTASCGGAGTFSASDALVLSVGP